MADDTMGAASAGMIERQAENVYRVNRLDQDSGKSSQDYFREELDRKRKESGEQEEDEGDSRDKNEPVNKPDAAESLLAGADQVILSDIARAAATPPEVPPAPAASSVEPQPPEPPEEDKETPPGATHVNIIA